MDYIYFEEADGLYTLPEIVAAYTEAVQRVPSRLLLGKSAFGNRVRLRDHSVNRALQAEGYGEILPFDSNGGGNQKFFVQRDQLEFAIRLLKRHERPEELQADLENARAAVGRRREAQPVQFRSFSAADQLKIDAAIAAGRVTHCKPMFAFGAVPTNGVL